MARHRSSAVAVVDIAKPMIELDVGDPWGRVPHLTADSVYPDGPFVLYVPSLNGQWGAVAVRTAQEAVTIVNRVVGKRKAG